MAKTDNLTDFLTGVAGAIRSKKGTTALIDPQDFESEIGSIDTAKPEQTKTLTVTKNGTQSVAPDSGKVLSAVTVVTNVPATPTEEKSVDLAMASGDQVVTPTSGKNLTKVTVKKPATLIASNIKSGVNIGGVAGTLSPAKTEQAKTVDLAMASGNQTVSPDSGKVLSGVTITKPTTLVASNIKKGVTIGGVAGSYAPSTETKTVALSMASGNQVISKTSSKDGMTQVTVTKPSTMLPANIKKGVNIGGVTGTYEGDSSGGGGEEVWTLDLRSPGSISTSDSVAWTDQVAYHVTALKYKQYFYLSQRAGSVYMNFIEAPSSNTANASKIKRRAPGDVSQLVGSYNSVSEQFRYSDTLDATQRKWVFPNGVTDTDLKVLLEAIAYKQPTDYAIQGEADILDTKEVTITSNGTTTITPDAPYDAMKSVQVAVNVAGSSKIANIALSGSVSFFIEVFDTANPANVLAHLNYMDNTDRGYLRLPIQGNLKLKTQGYWVKNQFPTYTNMTLLTPTTGETSELEYSIIGAVGSITDLGTTTCLIKGTLITLADGSKKPVEDITYDDELLVWNFYKGCFDKATPRWIKIAQTANVYNKLTFNNGTTLGLVGEGGTQGYHRIFNEQARLFTHTGVPETPIGTITFAEDCTKPVLVKQELIYGEVEFYNIITETHFNLFANGILTSCKNSNKYYIENMKYLTDKELMTDAEIEQDMLNREPIKLKKEIKQ